MKWNALVNVLIKYGITGIPVYSARSIAYLREVIRQSDIIWGKGIREQNTCMLYGRKQVQECLKTGVPFDAKVSIIELDYDTRELECVCAAITAIKGSCDYGTENEIDIESVIRMWTKQVYDSEKKTNEITTMPVDIWNQQATKGSN